MVTVQSFLGFRLRICFMRLCPSPGSAGRSISCTEGQSNGADSKGKEATEPCLGPLYRDVMLENGGSSSHWEFHFANPNLSFSMPGGEKPWRKERKHPLGFVLQNQTKHSVCILSLITQEFYLSQVRGQSWALTFISLSTSEVQDRTSTLCPQMHVIQTRHKYTVSL